MKRIYPAEVWQDLNGNIAIKNIDGDYIVYLLPETISVTQEGFFTERREVLSNMSYIRNRVTDVKLRILNAKREN